MQWESPEKENWCIRPKGFASNIHHNSSTEGFSCFKFTKDVFAEGSAYLIDIAWLLIDYDFDMQGFE